MKSSINKKTIGLMVAGLLASGLIGYFIGSLGEEAEHDHSTMLAQASEEVWTCSMHPQVRREEPGDCPICGMALIPLQSENAGMDPTAVSMSPTAMQLANVQTWVVGSGEQNAKSIRLNGKVETDERLLFTQTAHIPGRVEKLMVNFTGEYVAQGQTIALVYSPELVTAQEELFQAQKISETQPALFQSAKKKLMNWKLTEAQVEAVLASGEPIREFPIKANISGYVTEKMVNLGDYLKSGQPLYEIADLSKVWILFDVYESDMLWVEKGDEVTYTVNALPGETFTGEISFIDPVIDPVTRVAQARVIAPNKEGELKPEMFVSGTLTSEVEQEGSGLKVPKSAVMWTGKRSVVYVKNNTSEGVNFSLREVTLGPSLGESFVVTSGLEIGEEIAVNGTFSIDAAAQLAGKPSMMSPDGSSGKATHDHGNMPAMAMEKMKIGEEAKMQLMPLFTAYFEMKKALSEDDFKAAKAAAQTLDKELNNTHSTAFKGEAAKAWEGYSSALKTATAPLGQIAEIEKMREVFIPISNTMIGIAEAFDPLSETVYVQHCPMANRDQGADWLSKEKKILNPYFGAAMLGCGETVRTLK